MIESQALLTLCDLLSTIDLCDLFLQEFVTFLADGDDLLPRSAKCSDGLQNLLGDLGSALVLCEGVGVTESVV